VRRIIAECNTKVENLLTTNRAKLDLIAKALLEKETLTGQEVYELCGIALPAGWEKHNLGAKNVFEPDNDIIVEPKPEAQS
jgi:hypothetical protein